MTQTPMSPVCRGWEVDGYPDHPEIVIDVEHKPREGWESLLGCVVEMGRVEGSVLVQLAEFRGQFPGPDGGHWGVQCGLFLAFACTAEQRDPYHIVLAGDVVRWAGVATDAMDAIQRMGTVIDDPIPNKGWDELGDGQPRYVIEERGWNPDAEFRVVCPNGSGVVVVRDRMHRKYEEWCAGRDAMDASIFWE